MRSAEKHLTAATEARSYMRSQVELSRKELQRVFESTTSVPRLGSSLPACSNQLTVHFSFDFAQQVNLAPNKKYYKNDLYTLGSHSAQPPATRPHLLPCAEEVWICCEAIPRQVGHVAYIG